MSVHLVISAGQSKTGSSGPICLQHSHSFKVLSSASHTQLRLSAPRFKSIVIVRWRKCMELWIYCFCKALNAGTFSPIRQRFFDEGIYPSYHDFSRVKIIAHNSFSCANWKVTYFTNFRNSYMWIFFHKFLHKKQLPHSWPKPDDPDGDHLQSWLLQLWIPQSLCKRCSTKHSWLHTSVKSAWIFMRLSPSFICVWTHTNNIAQLWDHFFPGTVEDVTFLIMSNNHMADDANTILCMVMG